MALRAKGLEEQLRQMQGSIVCGLNQLLDLRDLSTGTHSTRLAEWGVRLAVDFGLDEDHQRNIEVACLLHDIGKIGVPDAILHKEGPLTPEERQWMNRHPEYGWAILSLFPGFELASLFALHHHERFDGTGYPGDSFRNEFGSTSPYLRKAALGGPLLLLRKESVRLAELASAYSSRHGIAVTRSVSFRARGTRQTRKPCLARPG